MARASRSKRTLISGFAAASGVRTFTATSRRSRQVVRAVTALDPATPEDRDQLVVREPITSGTRVGGCVFRDEEHNVTTLPHDSFVPLHVDAVVKIAPAKPGFVPPNLASAVAFMERGPVFGHPMDHILRNLSRMTRQKVESCRRQFVGAGVRDCLTPKLLTCGSGPSTGRSRMAVSRRRGTISTSCGNN